MKTIRLVFVLLAVFGSQSLWATSDTTPSLFSLTYYELYGTPAEPLNYAQTTTDALGFDILAEYNPSYYASIGLNFEKTSFYDGYNTTVSFWGLETRFFGAPNGKNPFSPYIYGGVGLGKTHLAQAIGNEIKQTLPDKLVLYVSCEKFTQQFVDALKHNNINDFVNFYQAIDVLIMDVTNAVRYWDEWNTIFPVMEKMKAEGNRVPQFSPNKDDLENYA